MDGKKSEGRLIKGRGRMTHIFVKNDTHFCEPCFCGRHYKQLVQYTDVRCVL